MPCQLTEDEKAIRSSELAAATRDFFDARERMDAAKQEFKATRETLQDVIDAAMSNTRKLGNIVRTGHEERAVKCDDIVASKRGMVDRVRRDTGEVVGTRAMTEAERQRALFDIADPDEA